MKASAGNPPRPAGRLCGASPSPCMKAVPRLCHQLKPESTGTRYKKHMCDSNTSEVRGISHDRRPSRRLSTIPRPRCRGAQSQCLGYRYYHNICASALRIGKSERSGGERLLSNPRGIQWAGFRAEGSGLRAQGSGLRAQGSGLRVQASGFRVQSSGFRAQGSGFRCDRERRTRSLACSLVTCGLSASACNLLLSSAHSVGNRVHLGDAK